MEDPADEPKNASLKNIGVCDPKVREALVTRSPHLPNA